MTAQYFFFDTDVGLFLQMIPLALAAGLLFLAVQRRRRPETPRRERLLSALFVCYFAALLGLTLFSRPIASLYSALFYGRPFHWEIPAGGWTYDFTLTCFRRFTGENLGNLLLFLPFGVLYPLFDRRAGSKKILLCGVGASLLIENLQPLLGRAFDVNDLVLNAMGTALGLALYRAAMHFRSRRGKPDKHP